MPAQKTLKAKDVPATQGMLQLVRTELKADIREVRSEMQAGFANVDARFSRVDARFSEVDAQFLDVKSEFKKVDAKLEHVLSEVARVGVLVEEQNANNRVVLEGLSSLWQRQDRFEVVLKDEVNRAVAGTLAVWAKTRS